MRERERERDAQYYLYVLNRAKAKNTECRMVIHLSYVPVLVTVVVSGFINKGDLNDTEWLF